MGIQYRSVIFGNTAQCRIAEKVCADLVQESVWDAPIQTKIELEKTFGSTEEYNVNYFAWNPENAYCAVVVHKNIQVRKVFRDLFKINKKGDALVA